MIWYPYEQMKTMKEPYKIIDAQGVYLYTEDAKLIDSISSWWCMIHGYKHPKLTNAIKEQADNFCHVMLGGLTHQPVQKLSKKLQEFLPGDLDYCFYSDSGSVAVEVALKMALQFNTNRGSSRSTVLALEYAYHGDTFKAMEVGDDEDYHFAFAEKTGVIHIPTTIEALETAFQEHGNALACSVALAGIELFEQEHYMDKIHRIEAIMKREMEGFGDDRIQEVRIMGGCVCIEVKDAATLKGFQEFAYQNGVFSRPFLKYMYAMVPYIIEETELVQILDTMKAWFTR